MVQTYLPFTVKHAPGRSKNEGKQMTQYSTGTLAVLNICHIPFNVSFLIFVCRAAKSKKYRVYINEFELFLGSQADAQRSRICFSSYTAHDGPHSLDIRNVGGMYWRGLMSSITNCYTVSVAVQVQLVYRGAVTR